MKIYIATIFSIGLFAVCTSSSMLVDCQTHSPSQIVEEDNRGILAFGEAQNHLILWNKLIDEISQNQSDLSQINDFISNIGFPVNFYPLLTENRCNIPNNLSRIESYGSCGSELTLFIKSLDKTNYPFQSIEPDFVYEIDESGSVIQSWAVPINKTVLGIRENELYVNEVLSKIRSKIGTIDRFSSRIYVVLVIQNNGKLSVLERPVNPERPKYIECPPSPLFKGSAYKSCWKYIDMKTEKVRTLVLQGPCT